MWKPSGNHIGVSRNGNYGETTDVTIPSGFQQVSIFGKPLFSPSVTLLCIQRIDINTNRYQCIVEIISVSETSTLLTDLALERHFFAKTDNDFGRTCESLCVYPLARGFSFVRFCG